MGRSTLLINLSSVVRHFSSSHSSQRAAVSTLSYTHIWGNSPGGSEEHTSEHQSRRQLVCGHALQLKQPVLVHPSHACDPAQPAIRSMPALHDALPISQIIRLDSDPAIRWVNLLFSLIFLQCFDIFLHPALVNEER